MTIFNPNKSLINARVAGFIIIAVLMLMVAGCTKNYGRFAKSNEVGLAFRQGDRQSDYRYYYSGRDNMPYAIIGIDPSYTVPSRYWILFEAEQEILSKMSENMYGKHTYSPTGFHIMDPDGNIIGVWFSSVNQYSVSVDQQNRMVEVLFPNPENSRSMSVGLSSRSNWQSNRIGS